MFGLGMGEIALIVVGIVVLFGASKLPQLGSGLGKAITNFKKGLAEGKKELEDQSNNDPKDPKE